MANYLTEEILPSNGKLAGVPTKVTLKAISTKEEKLIFGSSTDNAFDKVLKACIVEPEKFDLNSLTTPDKFALLLKLRIHTYGNEYWVSTKCPVCGKVSEVCINLDELQVDLLGDDFTEDITINLPVSKDVLVVNLLTGHDLDTVEMQAKRRAKSSKSVNYAEIEYILRMSRYIKKVNGEEVDYITNSKYVEEMHGRDSAYFWHVLNNIKFGYDSKVSVECEKCKEEHEFGLPINSEFFRPSFR